MISILMGTHNGEKYLQAQLDSLLNQTYNDFTLWISDDASTDKTWDILHAYANLHPDKIKITRKEKNTGNAKYNFLSMMTQIKDDYVMLCDQDDVWLPQKIEKTLAKMQETEKQHPGTPILVRTDMKVVDRDLKTINLSYRKAMCSNFNRTGFNQVLIQNSFAGCTAMYNRPLAEIINQEPDYCIMHDWWLELVASAFGRITQVDEPTILYRQHGENEIGAKDVRKLSYKVNRLINYKEIKKAIQITYTQAESFLRCYEEQLTEEKKDIAQKYCAIPKMKKVSRWRTICSLRAFKNGLGRNIAYFLFV